MDGERLSLSRTREWTMIRGVRSVIVRLGSPVSVSWANLSMEASAVEFDWNRYDLDVVLRARLD